MVFASSRDALKRSLTGIAVEIQGTDFGEVAYESGEFPTQRGGQVSVYIQSMLIHVFFPFSLVLDKANRGN